MAALGDRLVTMLDVSKSKNKAIGKVAEVLVQENSMLNDIPYMEMNDGTSHKEEIRSALPAIYYRKANQAIPASKTTTEERSFDAAHFESKSQIDDLVARRGGADRIAYNRWNQAQGHLQAHAIEHASLTIYGSPVNGSTKTAGFFDVYSTLSASEPTSKQIVDAGGTGSDNASILMVSWGERTVFGVYPAGTTAGLKRVDRSAGGKLVQIQATDINGNPGAFWGWEEDFSVDHGLVIKDYRAAGRIANISTANLKSGAAAADLFDFLISLAYKVKAYGGKQIIYTNATVLAFLDKQALTKVGAGAGLRYDNYQGQPVLMWRGIPVRQSDAMLNTEAQVV